MKDKFRVSKTDFIKGIRDAGIGAGDIVYVASSMMALGLMEDPIKNVIESLIEVVGLDGTIVMPAFNFEFCKTGMFNRALTLSESGVLTEAFRLFPGVLRTMYTPEHTVSVWGKLARELSEIKAITSFGKSSVFHRLFELNAKYLLIGCNFHQGVVHVHWLEEMHQVPYRYWKRFSGVVVDGFTSVDTEFFMYARNINDLGISINSEFAGAQFDAAGYIKHAQVGLCKLSSFSIGDFEQFMAPLLKTDKFLFVDKKNTNSVASFINKIDHIAIVSKYADKIKTVFNDFACFTNSQTVMQELGVRCEYFDGLNVKIEFVEPIQERNVVENYLKKNAPSPLHHIALEVSDMQQAINFFKQKNYSLLDGQVYKAYGFNQEVAFLSPLSTGGVLIELVAKK